jgi:hypothetical protein
MAAVYLMDRVDESHGFSGVHITNTHVDELPQDLVGRRHPQGRTTFTLVLFRNDTMEPNAVIEIGPRPLTPIVVGRDIDFVVAMATI